MFKREIIVSRMKDLEQQLKIQESMAQQCQANAIALRGALQFAQDLLDKPEEVEEPTTDDEKLVPFPTAEPAKSLDA